MTIFATFNGFKNMKNQPSLFIWDNLSNELGEPMKGLYLSNKEPIFNKLRLKFGNRYRISCDEIINSGIFNISEVKTINKNPRCGIFRRFKDEFHIIGGKYKGKKDKDVDSLKLTQYCIWLVRNSNNEVTIKNALQILKNLHGEEKY